MKFGVPLLLLASLPMFLLNIDFPTEPAGEEVHYVRAARSWLAVGADSNLEHPPLAKLIIAVGIKIFGDEPLGWRFFSAVAGTLALIAMYGWGLALFNNRTSAAFAALFSALNLMLWTESHLATLEIYQTAFTLGGCAACTGIWFDPTDSRKRRMLFAAGGGLLFGLAIASKWFAIVAWLPCAFGSLGLSLARQNRQVKQSLTPTHLLLFLFALPVLVYTLTYAPYIAHQGWRRWLELQVMMWIDQTDAQVVASAQPMPWYRWPFNFYPQFLAYDLNPPQSLYRTLALLANPIVVIGGALTALLALWQNRSREAKIALLFPALFFFAWAVIPHKHQHYYYFFPAVMSLSLPLAAPGRARKWLALTAASLFIYFLPVVAGFTISTSLPWAWLYRSLTVSN